MSVWETPEETVHPEMRKQETKAQADVVERPYHTLSDVGKSDVPSHTSVLGRPHLGTQDALPADVLAEIFVLTLSVDGVHLRHRLSDAPWMLLQVCSQWRQAALGEHRLWNSLVANISVDTMKSWLHTLWPRHSKSLVSLDIQRSHKALEIYNILNEHASRLRVLSIAKLVDVISDLTQHMPLAFEHLEALSLGPGWTTQVSPGVSAALFGNVPKLRNINFIGVHAFRKMGPDIPWRQLTDLTLSGATPSYGEIHAILRQCPVLVRFTVVLWMNNRVDHIPLSPDTILPALQELTVILAPAALLDGFFLRLVMPSLRKLMFPSQRDDSSRPVRTFRLPQREVLDMLDRSPHVENIEFGCSFFNADLITLMKRTPALTTLLIRQDISSEIFGMIRSGELLQKLVRLECSTQHPGYVLDLLEHQCSSIGVREYRGLTTICIVFHKVEDLNEVQRRVGELEVQMHGIGDGRVLEMKEVEFGGRMIMALVRY